MTVAASSAFSKRAHARRTILRLGLGLLAVGAAAACTDTESPAELRIVDGVPDFPAFVYVSEKSIRGYALAISHRAAVKQVPCYCGCGVDPRYRSLLDCFLTSDGVWDAHASNCEICLDEAIAVAEMCVRGMSLTAIRAAIDARYARYGPPTDTPPVGA